MVIERDADAPAAAGPVFLGLAPVIGLAGDDVQHLGELDLLDDVTVGRGLVALLGEVLHLEFQRVHAEVVRQMVQMTPYGPIQMDITTTGVNLGEEEELLEIKTEYVLGMNGQKVADCQMHIRVTPKGSKETTFFRA